MEVLRELKKLKKVKVEEVSRFFSVKMIDAVDRSTIEK